MYTYNKILFFISTLFISLYSFGTHVGGGFISYECTGNPREYRIRLILYDDCNGTVDVGPTQTVNFYNSCGINVPNNLQETCNFFGCSGGATLFQIYEQEVSQLCASELGNSYCNGGTLPGYLEHIYEGVVTLPDDCDTWTIRYNLCCRNLADNATISTSNDDYYIETIMYTSTDDCNNSPQITAAPQPYVCVNQNVTYNLGAFETDGDNFTYELVDSRVDPTTTVGYNGGFSGAAPVNEASIDPTTGLFTYTPTAQGTYIVAIKINEYNDNGDLISESIYDYQTVVIACTNDSPTPDPIGIHNIAGPAVQNSPNDITLCFNESTCFEIEFEDVNGGDVLTVTSNLANVFPSGNITYAGTNPIVATICFDVGAVELSNDITFLVQDDACPIYGQNNYTITINTIECDFCTVDLTADIVNCVTTPTLGYDIEGTVTFDDPPATGQLIIENCHGDQIIENLPLASPYDYTFTNVPSAGGDCDITATFTDDPTCTASATVVLETPTPVEAGPDQEVCDDGTQVTLSGSDAITYTWDNGVFDGVAFTPATTTTYTVTGTDGNGCETTDQLEVRVNVTPTVDAPADVTKCDSYILPALTEGNYFTETAGGGTALMAGDEITTTQTIYVYAETGTAPNCSAENSFVVTINTTPTVDAPSDVTACDSYILPALSEGNYFTETAGGGTPMLAGDGITTTQTIYVYAETGTTPNCTAENSFTVTINTTPTLDAPADVTECDSYILPALTEGNYFTETAGGGTALVAADAITTTQNIYVYAETGTTPNCTDENSFVVTINPLPNVDAGPDQEICVGEEVTLNGSGAVTYTWDNGVTDGVAFTPAGTAMYIVTGVDANNCENTDEVEVVVNSLPTVDAGPDQVICTDEEVSLNGSGAVTYTWDNGVTDGVIFSPSSTTTYTVLGVDANNCEDKDEVEVVVNPLPIIDAGPDQQLCEGEDVILEATGGLTYTWTPSISNGIAFTQDLGTETYAVVGVDQNGCQNTDEVMVSVFANPEVFAGNDLTICRGETVVLTATGAQDYEWNHGVVNGDPFIPGDTRTYIVTGLTSVGCQDVDSVEIIVIPIPNAEFTGENLFGCSPITPVLTNTTAGDGYDNCTWYFGNGESLQGCNEVSLTFVETGCYDVSLTVSTPEGCSNTMTAPNFICVDPSPVAAFTANPTYLTSANPMADFTNQSIDATIYSWDFGDGSFPNTEEHPSHQYPDPTQSYTVTLTAFSEAGCPDTTSLDIDVEETLLFYVPNAFTPDDGYGKINEVFKPVFTTGFDPFNYQLLIFNRWGELLFESNDTDFGWPGTYGVDGEIVKDDVYIWKIRFNRKADGEEEVHVGHVTLLK